MTEPTDPDDPKMDLSKRGRHRAKNIIAKSPHKDVYRKLLENGWSSLALERFALITYGEDIPSRTFRTYRKSMNLTVTKRVAAPEEDLDPEALVDVLAERSELIRLQKARLAIDVGHEVKMGKLFSTTRGEIDMLNRMLDSYKGDLQDLGAFPKLGEVHRVQIGGNAGTGDPDEDGQVTGAMNATYAARRALPAKNLADLLSTTPDVERQMARMLHDALPSMNGHSNGQVYDAEIVEDGDDQQ